MKYFIILFVVLFSDSTFAKSKKNENCLMVLAKFLDSYDNEDRGWVIVNEDSVYTWATSNNMTEWILIAKSKGGFYMDFSRKCEYGADTLNVYTKRRMKK